MKRIVQLILILSVSFLNAQDLQIPNTPAFSILDYEPSSVMRPTSTKKLSTDLLNSFDSEGKLLMNLGLEVTPYWLKSRSGLTRKEYLEPTGFQSFLQTFSLSAATVKDTITGDNNLGVGFRVQLIKGDLTDEFKKHEESLKQIETIIGFITAARDFTGNQINSRKEAIDFIILKIEDNQEKINISDEKIEEIKQRSILLANKYEDDTNSIKDFCAALNDSFEDETDELAEKVIELENKRTGFSLEIASAGKFITTPNDQAFQKAGFWVNGNNYFTETDAWTITARLMTSVSDTTNTNFDAGIGYIKQGKSFNVSVEAMFRWYRSEIPDLNIDSMPITRLEKDFTYRLAAEASYMIAENISFNVSIGKDFEDAGISGSTFFSIFGINYSLFNKQKALYNTPLSLP